MGTLNLPVPSWRTSFAKVCIIFINLYAFGKGINKVQDVEQEKQTWNFLYRLIPLQLPNPEVIHILGPIFPPSVKHWSNSSWHKYICHSPTIWKWVIQLLTNRKKCWVEAWLYRINEFAEGPSQKWMEKQPPSDQQKQSSAMSTGTDKDSQSHQLGSGGWMKVPI